RAGARSPPPRARADAPRTDRDHLRGGEMLSTQLLAAGSSPPAGGAATSDVIYATAGAVVVTIVLLGPILLYKQGRFPLIGRLAEIDARATNLPGWAALPGS